MGTSTHYFKKETINFIVKNYDKNISILDIGAGCGTYYDLLNPLGYNNIDGVEAFYAYVKKFNLEKKYNKLFIGDITKLNINFNNYNLIIMGDVFEHLKKEDAKKLIEKISSKDIIIAIPFESEQTAINENVYEIHQQSDLTLFNFLQEYNNFNLLCLRFDYGVFTTRKNHEIYIEESEKTIPEKYLKFLISSYNQKDIIKV